MLCSAAKKENTVMYVLPFFFSILKKQGLMEDLLRI